MDSCTLSLVDLLYFVGWQCVLGRPCAVPWAPCQQPAMEQHSQCPWNICLALRAGIWEGRPLSFAKPEAEGDVSRFGVGSAGCEFVSKGSAMVVRQVKGQAGKLMWSSGLGSHRSDGWRCCGTAGGHMGMATAQWGPSLL